MRKATAITTGLILLSFIVSIYFYPLVPESMATHWNSQGEVNGYMPKFQGLFFMPLLITGLAVFYLAIPKIDPMKVNILKFGKYHEKFIIFLILFLLAVHLQILLWNAGIQINPNAVLPVGIGLLFYYIGILMEHAERNWFIGIRNPWTLSSDRIWKKTNRLGGKLFRVAGIVAVLGVFYPGFEFIFILVPALFIVGFAAVYSYLEYQKELKGTKSQIKT
ncbi:membrane protein, putative [Methanosarcina barkeri str. Wiesmoor]|uniref:Membrane protein, putative n=2 Tax=Methanosarcina barkeri TaxID=2208 RepID=A0A0E3QNQ7_METBA|nr:SdpI family protein [Methanosarcina barkeri]AKB52047.1 membrane protein, putative [Methanosarcina barkeri str. Wiesmoor]